MLNTSMRKNRLCLGWNGCVLIVIKFWLKTNKNEIINITEFTNTKHRSLNGSIKPVKYIK